MRITGGSFRGRKLKQISWAGTRCSTDKVRQALFNILGPDFIYDEVNVLDCFAGSGAVSVEFISRGAKWVKSVDFNQKCCSYMESLKASFTIDNWQISCSNVQRVLNESDKFDLIFADPPYSDADINEFIDSVLDGTVLKKSGIFVLEHSSKIQFDRKELSKSKKYGESCLSFYIKER